MLVELFTSEGCSSCPPADRLLQELDRQPVAGAQLIGLSEHVDYWNHIGWKDPYSSRFFSDRQSAYAAHFGLSTVYTPEMVVDGAGEFVGSDSGRASQACGEALSSEKISVRISSLSVNGRNIQARVETGALPASSSQSQADVVAVLALNHAESQVSAGENSGRRLTHVAVVQSLTRVGTVEKGKPFAQDIRLKLPPGRDPSNLRLIAFVQESGPGKVLGAALEPVQK
ncbi:MAG TPA: DUF1223 domain-containing protein [Terriglobales bacterium]|nr:DUF1223 domain-containing protein [Terriglobales bacterium]